MCALSFLLAKFERLQHVVNTRASLALVASGQWAPKPRSRQDDPSEPVATSKHVRVYFHPNKVGQKALWHLQETVNTDLMDKVASQHGLAWEIRSEKEGAGVFCWPVKPAESADLELGYDALRELVGRRMGIVRAGGKLLKCSGQLKAAVATDEHSRRNLEKERSLVKKSRGRGRGSGCR